MKSPQPLHPEIEVGSRSALPKDLAPIIDSVWKLFERDACATMDGMLAVHDQLQECVEHGAAEGGDPNLAFESAHRIVTEARHKWSWELRKIADDYVARLAQLSRARPDWVTEDPAVWARRRTKDFLLDRWLDGWKFPRIVSWFKNVCDGPLDLDRGRPEPWCVPTWVVRQRDWNNDPARLDERLTPELTQEFLLTRRKEFDFNFEHWLKEAEDAARVNLAMQPAPPAQHKERLGTNPGARQRKNGASRNRANKILFVRDSDGTTVANPPYSGRALLNSFEALWRSLDRVRTMVINGKGTLSASDVREKFRATELEGAAGTDDWQRWIEDFADRKVTAKGVALVFLETKTGLKRGSIKTLISRARRKSTTVDQC